MLINRLIGISCLLCSDLLERLLVAILSVTNSKLVPNDRNILHMGNAANTVNPVPSIPSLAPNVHIP